MTSSHLAALEKHLREGRTRDVTGRALKRAEALVELYDREGPEPDLTLRRLPPPQVYDGDRMQF